VRLAAQVRSQDVHLQVGFPCEPSAAVKASVRSRASSMHQQVTTQVVALDEGSTAHVAEIRPEVRVVLKVDLQKGAVSEGPIAEGAL